MVWRNWDLIFAGLPIETCSLYMILCNRWFCVETGNADNHSVLLIHGFPSQVSVPLSILVVHFRWWSFHMDNLMYWQAYSFRRVLPVLSKNYHAIAFDWLGKIMLPITMNCNRFWVLVLEVEFWGFTEIYIFQDKLREKICLHLISTGFGFSEKPQPGYGFDYTLDGNALVALMMADKC